MDSPLRAVSFQVPVCSTVSTPDLSFIPLVNYIHTSKTSIGLNIYVPLFLLQLLQLLKLLFCSMKDLMFSPIHDAILLRVGVPLGGASQLQLLDEQLLSCGCCHCEKSRHHNPLGSKAQLGGSEKEHGSEVGPIVQFVIECLLTLISWAAGGCCIICS